MDLILHLQWHWFEGWGLTCMQMRVCNANSACLSMPMFTTAQEGPCNKRAISSQTRICNRVWWCTGCATCIWPNCKLYFKMVFSCYPYYTGKTLYAGNTRVWSTVVRTTAAVVELFSHQGCADCKLHPSPAWGEIFYIFCWWNISKNHFLLWGLQPCFFFLMEVADYLLPYLFPSCNISANVWFRIRLFLNKVKGFQRSTPSGLHFRH